MTVGRIRERVVAWLLTESRRSHCARCLGTALNLAHKAVHEAILTLEADPRFARHYGQCAACKKTRIVIAYRAEV